MIASSLHEFETGTRKTRLLACSAVFCVSFTYAVVNAIFLGRRESQVAAETTALTGLMVFSASLIAVIGATRGRHSLAVSGTVGVDAYVPIPSGHAWFAQLASLLLHAAIILTVVLPYTLTPSHGPALLLLERVIALVPSPTVSPQARVMPPETALRNPLFATPFEGRRSTERVFESLERALSSDLLSSTASKLRFEVLERRSQLLREKTRLLEQQQILERMMAENSQPLARPGNTEMKRLLIEVQKANQAEIKRLDELKGYFDDELRRLDEMEASVAAERQALSGPVGQMPYRIVIAPMQDSQLMEVLQRNQGAVGFEQPLGSGNLVLFRRDREQWEKVGNGSCESLLCFFGPETDDIRQLRTREGLPAPASVVYAFPARFQQVLLSRIRERLRGSPNPLQPVLVRLVFNATEPSGLEIKEIRPSQ